MKKSRRDEGCYPSPLISKEALCLSHRVCLLASTGAPRDITSVCPRPTIAVRNSGYLRILRPAWRTWLNGLRPRRSFAIGRSWLCWLAYSAVRVGELVKLRVRDYQSTSGHRVIEVKGKGGKERRVPLHPEVCERLEAWIQLAGLTNDREGPVFRAAKTARGSGHDGFQAMPLSKRGV
jgi:integrase